jgi:hypothetical protein
MELTPSKIPDGAAEALRSGLSDVLMAPQNAGLRDVSDQLETGNVTTFAPHVVYLLDSSMLDSVIDLKRAHPASIRYFVGDPHEGGPTAVADVGLDTNGEVRGFSRLTRGPGVTTQWEAVKAAADIQDDGAAEVRMLEAPAIHIAALWLAGDNAAADHFIPLRDSGESLKALQVYGYAAFITGLQVAVDRFQQLPSEFPV